MTSFLLRTAQGLSRTPLHRVLRWAATKLARYVDVAENFSNGDFESNGEAFLVSKGAPHWRVALDVGANIGDWTAAALAANPTLHVHCFEPSPATSSILEKRFRGDARVVVHALGVGAEPGELPFFEHGLAAGSNGFIERAVTLGASNRTQSARITTVDDHLRSTKLSDVDFVKIDTEGFEMAVLLGMRDSLRKKRIAAIQFEYGGTWRDANHKLADAFRVFADAGYLVYRLLPRGVIGAELPDADDYRYANYLAVRDMQPLRSWGLAG